MANFILRAENGPMSEDPNVGLLFVIALLAVLIAGHRIARRGFFYRHAPLEFTGWFLLGGLIIVGWWLRADGTARVAQGMGAAMIVPLIAQYVFWVVLGWEAVAAATKLSGRLIRTLEAVLSPDVVARQAAWVIALFMCTALGLLVFWVVGMGASLGMHLVPLLFVAVASILVPLWLLLAPSHWNWGWYHQPLGRARTALCVLLAAALTAALMIVTAAGQELDTVAVVVSAIPLAPATIVFIVLSLYSVVKVSARCVPQQYERSETRTRERGGLMLIYLGAMLLTAVSLVFLVNVDGWAATVDGPSLDVFTRGCFLLGSLIAGFYYLVRLAREGVDVFLGPSPS
jgi:hypothetical protein